MAKNQVILEVLEIKGRCPLYKMGDKIVIDPVPGEDISTINLKETDTICTRILGSLSSCHAWLECAKPSPDDARERRTWQRALGPTYLKCPMVGPPYSKCGYITFKVTGIPRVKGD